MGDDKTQPRNTIEQILEVLVAFPPIIQGLNDRLLALHKRIERIENTITDIEEIKE